MTKTQKALRGIGSYLLANVKPKVGRRLDRDRRYRERFWDKQTRNMQAAAKRVQQRSEEARGVADKKSDAYDVWAIARGEGR